MVTSTPNILIMNLVLVGIDLLNDSTSIEIFKGQTDPDLQIEVGMMTEIPTGITGPSRRVNLNRDRIVLELSPARSSVARQYPNDRSDIAQLTAVANSAIECSTLADQRVSFGFNIELVYEQDSGQSAMEYLGSRLFGSLKLGRDAWTLAGGTGQIIFDEKDGSCRWTMNVRPRSIAEDTPRILLGMNLHRSMADIPSAKVIEDSLEELWDEAHDFVLRLDECGNL